MAVLGLRARRSFAATLVCSVAVALGLAGCAVEPDTGGEVLPSERLASLVAALPEQSASPASIPRPDNTAAPTNRWYSGAVFGDGTSPVFPMPISFQVVPGGFAFGLPQVAAGGAGVVAPAATDVTVMTDTDGVRLVRWDDVSVTLGLTRDGKVQAEVTIARGSPLVSLRAIDATSLTLSVAMTPDAGAAVAEIAGRQVAMVAPDGALDDNGTTVSVDADASVQWFPVPEGGDVSLLAAAASPISAVTTQYDVGDSTTTTRLHYETEADAPTLIAITAAQAAARDESDGLQCGLGEFTTTLGVMHLCSGSALSWSAPRIDPAAALNLDDISAEEADELRTVVTADAATVTFADDSYFGGKALARAADLLVLAVQLGADDVAADLRERLAKELRTWADPAGCDTRASKCFVYDSDTGGVVGMQAAFGSEEFNDHHFHYGYFLYAAAIAVADDPELRADLEPTMTVLAADLASGSASDLFPLRRTFDPYSGHSWASGTAQFADGNNQESSSEAVAAWNGLGLWADVAGDTALAKEATWMLSSEAAASSDWLGFDRRAAPYDEYGHGVVGIVWDGKLDYATWFSPEPAAVLGIQLIPMGAVSDYLGADPGRIRSNVAETVATGAPAQFADLILMYQALAGPKDAAVALDAARDLPDSAIDDGNSRSHMLAFILSHR